MLTRFAAATALCLTLGLSPVIAQGTSPGTPPPGSPPAATPPPGGGGGGAQVTPIDRQQPGQWLADDLIGSNVYNQQGERIGDLNDLVIGQDGKVAAIVVGVGGFLGIGERDVAIPWNEVQMRPAAEVQRTAGADRGGGGAGGGTGAGGTTGATGGAGGTTGATGGGAGGTTGATGGGAGGATAGGGAGRGDQDMRIVVNATRDQLRNMQPFQSLDDQNRGGGGGGAGGGAARPGGGGAGGGGTPAPAPR